MKMKKIGRGGDASKILLCRSATDENKPFTTQGYCLSGFLFFANVRDKYLTIVVTNRSRGGSSIS